MSKKNLKQSIMKMAFMGDSFNIYKHVFLFVLSKIIVISFINFNFFISEEKMKIYFQIVFWFAIFSNSRLNNYILIQNSLTLSNFISQSSKPWIQGLHID